MAKKKTESRVVVHLSCSQCQEQTYTTVKNKKNDVQRLELKKYCPRCRAHTMHRETK